MAESLELMQIFQLHSHPRESAKILIEKSPIRARKQIVETMQLIANIAHKLNMQPPIKTSGDDYGITHPNHPMSKWIGKSSGNMNWAIENATWINHYLYSDANKNHGSLINKYSDNIKVAYEISSKLPIEDYKPLNLAKNASLEIDFTHLPVFEAYNKYLDYKLK